MENLLKQAIKNKNQAEIRTYRAIISEFQMFSKSPGKNSLTELDKIKILYKMFTQRQDSYLEFLQAGREDLAQLEMEELDIIKKLIPKPATASDIENYIGDRVITKKEMGILVKEIKNKFPTTDGKLIADVVKSKVV